MKLKFKLFCSLLLVMSCSDDDTLQPVTCANVACTQQFVTLNVRVQDKDGVNIPLDDFMVTDKITGDDLTASFTAQQLEQFRQSGTYPLYDDRFVTDHQNKKRSILFTGIINGEMVVDEPYVVRADCCHVSLVSGKDPIILDKT